MASRLKTRLSAGAALITGLGMVGIAAATPAQADVSAEFEYTCTALGGSVEFTDLWTVNLTVSGEEVVEAGTNIPAPNITAQVTPGNDAIGLMRLLGVQSLEGTATTTYSFGGDDRTADLTVANVEVPDEGDVTTVATGTGPAETAPGESGTVDIVAGDFTAQLTAELADAEAEPLALDIACTAPEGALVGSITVVEPEPEPEDNDNVDNGEGDNGTVEPSDWFAEPGSLPITEDGKHFTVDGTATRAGVLNVVLLDGDKKVLKTTPWDATEGTNTKNFPFVEGTDYVRLVSENCVDAEGNDETVVGSKCNVEYYAPWVNPEGNGGKDEGDDSTVEEPEIPGVVQTDGFAKTATPETNNTAALALGSLLLVGAGAGVVLVARRRQAAQH